MPENSPRFIHLRTHSEHSLLEGAVPVKKLADLAAQNGMPAVALTDTNALFAALEFSVKAQDAGVQPIIGCQVTLQAEMTGPIVLLAQNEAGWLNLMDLSTCLYLRDDNSLPHVTVDELETRAEGLICLTGGAGGPLGQLVLQGREAEARGLAQRLAAAFPTRLYVELQRHHDAEGQPVPEEVG